MTHLEAVTERLDAIKRDGPGAFHDHFAAATFRFRFVPAADRVRLVEDFQAWAAGPDGSPRMRAYARFLAALRHFLLEELRPSLQLLAEARLEFVELDDPEGRGLCAMLIGGIYRTFGNYDLALKTCVEGFELLKASGRYPMFLAAAANSLAGIHFDRGELDEARRMYEVTLAESIRADDFYFMIYALHGAGRVDLAEGRMTEAERSLQRALDIARRHEHPLHTANSLTELAALRLESGDLDAALALNGQALAIREERGLLPGAITSCLRLAEIRSRRHEWPEARRALDRGFEIAERLGVKPKLAQVHRALADLAHQAGEEGEALAHFRRFHELREDVEREDGARALSDARAIFESEQTRKENTIIRAQKAEIERQNAELQLTIDALTRARIGRKAKALTLALAIVLFVLQDQVLRVALGFVAGRSYVVLLGVKMAIIFSLMPINRGIELILLRRVARANRRRAVGDAQPVAAD